MSQPYIPILCDATKYLDNNKPHLTLSGQLTAGPTSNWFTSAREFKPHPQSASLIGGHTSLTSDQAASP